MRITNNLIFDQFRRNLQLSAENMLRSQEVMATQKKINRVSDDPLAAGLAQDARSRITATDQYVRNLGRAQSDANLTDTFLSQCEDLLSRAKELMVSQANTATATSSTREAVAIELVSLRSQLLAIANSRIGANYAFAGTADGQMPFTPMSAAAAPPSYAGRASATTQILDEKAVTGDAYRITFTAPGTYDVTDVTKGVTLASGAAYASGGDIEFDGLLVKITDAPGAPVAGDTYDVTVTMPGQYLGNSNERKVEIERNSYVPTNTPGDRIFLGAGLAGGINVFNVFNGAINALRNNDASGIDATLDQFDNSHRQISGQRSVVGARQNLFDTTNTRLKSQGLEFETQRTLLEDADLADASTEFNKRETAYQAALSVTSRIGQISLLDFLK